MIKNVLKEIIIMLLLLLAIILILGVLLYGYVPINKKDKIIPERISYTTSKEVKEELQYDESIDDTQIVLTHQIDATDLSNYKQMQEYVPGRKNPFGTPEVKQEKTEDKESTTESSNAGDSESSGKTSTSSNANSSSKTENNNQYLPDKGTK